MRTDDLFLSQAVLCVDPRGAPRGMDVTYLLHQGIASLFGQYERRPYLYRVDGQSDIAYVALILSTGQPSVPLVRTAGVMFSELATKPFDIRVAPGTLLDYEIRLNATKDVVQGVGSNATKRRTDVWEAVWGIDRNTPRTQHEVYGGYLRRRLAGVATVRTAQVTERGLLLATRPGRGRKPITVVATNVIGTLEVTDTNALVAAVRRGLGRAKAFGCGLLCLSRPGTVLPRRHAAASDRAY